MKALDCTLQVISFVAQPASQTQCFVSFVVCRTSVRTRARAFLFWRQSKIPEARIGYCMKMALQTADAAPVRYGPTRWERVSFEEVQDLLPKDPRQWTREHVAQWLDLVIQEHGLPEVPPSRFLMNGKALCLMSLSMFLSRVPLGGKLLYKDFQLRLCAALYGVNH